MKRLAPVFSLCFLFALLCLWPLLGAGLRTDDWSWLAMAHLLDNPLDSYFHNIGWGYFHRPSAMVLWWLSERLAGDSSVWHYLINIVLHSASASCLVLLLRAAGRPVWLSMGIGLAYVCCPAIAGTSLWLSSRNEMLALFAGLLSMLLLERQINRHRFKGLTIGFVLFIALTAKESAYLFPIACAFRVFLDSDLRKTLNRKESARIILFLSLPLLLAASLRSMTIVPIGPEANPDSLFEVLYTGISHWLRLWPSAISGFDAQRIYWFYFAAIGLLVLLALSAVNANSKAKAWAIAGLLLLIAPGALQAPITATVLNQAAATGFAENLRFFATSALGVFLLAGMCLPVAAYRVSSGIAVCVLLMVGGITSNNLASSWRINTQADDHQARRLAELVPSRMTAPHCRVLIKAEISASIAPWIDPVLKSQWPQNAESQYCGFFVQSQESYYQILPYSECEKTRWPNQAFRQVESKPLRQSFGSVCQASLLAPDEKDASRVIELPNLD